MVIPRNSRQAPSLKNAFERAGVVAGRRQPNLQYFTGLDLNSGRKQAPCKYLQEYRRATIRDAVHSRPVTKVSCNSQVQERQLFCQRHLIYHVMVASLLRMRSRSSRVQARGTVRSLWSLWSYSTLCSAAFCAPNHSYGSRGTLRKQEGRREELQLWVTWWRPGMLDSRCLFCVVGAVAPFLLCQISLEMG